MVRIGWVALGVVLASSTGCGGNGSGGSTGSTGSTRGSGSTTSTTSGTGTPSSGTSAGTTSAGTTSAGTTGGTTAATGTTSASTTSAAGSSGNTTATGAGSVGSNGTTTTSAGSSSGTAGTTGTTGGTGGLVCTPGVEGFGVPLISAGNDPETVKLADINHDGKLDVLLVNTSVRTLSVMLGYGDGTFANRSTFNLSPAQAPMGLAVGEFDGDGNLDVAVGDTGVYGSISLLRGAGTGAFTPFATVTPSSLSNRAFSPADVAAADLNRDGRADVIAVNGYYDQVVVYYGQDGGGVGAPQIFGTLSGAGYQALAVADFTGAGQPDVAALGSGGVKLFVNAGGTLAEQSGVLNTVPGPVTIAADDLNGDGHVDLVVGGQGVSVLLNQGNASFANAVTLTTAFTYVAAVGVGDFDHDGKRDIIALGTTAPRMVEVFYGDGTGQFPRTAVFDTVDGLALAAADLNGDGYTDAVATGAGGTLQVLMANPDGTLLAGRSVTPTASRGLSNAIVAADINGDGVPDFIENGFYDANVVVTLSSGPGVYQVPVPYALGANSTPSGLAVADFNGDGKPDLVISNSGTGQVEFRAGDGAGTFGLPKYTPVSVAGYPGQPALTAADFFHHGQLDVAVVDATNQKIQVLRNQASTTSQFATPQAVPLPSGLSPSAVVSGHFSAGPGPDIAVLGQNGMEIATLMNDGAGAFPTVAVTMLSSAAVSLTVVPSPGGLDGLVVGETSGNVEILRGASSGTFAVSPAVGVIHAERGAALADLNGDGYPDAVTASYHGVSVYLGLQGGGFGTELSYPVENPGAPHLVDLNGDGKPDLYLTSADGLSYLLTSCWH